jgi:hypothetical protein
MVHAAKVYYMLMAPSILLSVATISLILFVTSPRYTENATMILYAYILAPSFALIHHIITSLCSHPDLPPPPTPQSTTVSVAAPNKQISSTTNLLCLALLAVFLLASGFAVLVQSMVDVTTLDRIAQSATATVTEGSKSVAATGLKNALASNALVLQALFQIVQGIILGWMFGVAAQQAHIVIAIERGLDPLEIMVHIDVEQGDPHGRLSYDETEEEEEDKWYHSP